MFSDLIWKISLPCILTGGFFINFNMFMVAWEVWQLIIHRIIIILHEFYVTRPFFLVKKHHFLEVNCTYLTPFKLWQCSLILCARMFLAFINVWCFFMSCPPRCSWALCLVMEKYEQCMHMHMDKQSVKRIYFSFSKKYNWFFIILFQPTCSINSVRNASCFLFQETKHFSQSFM